MSEHEQAADAREMRTLVGGLLGDTEQLRALDDGTIRTLSTVLLERMMFARQAGISFHGARDLYEVLGYDRVLTYRKYRARYARGGIAKRIVEAYPKATWRGGVKLFEGAEATDADRDGKTAFEQAWNDLEKRLSIWATIQQADILTGLSTYSAVLIGAPGSLTDELPKGTPEKLLYLTPFSGGGGPGGDQLSRSMAMDADCSIQTFDVDPASPRFGLPLIYRLRRTDLSSPLLNREVHWTRLVHLAEGLLGDRVYGSPTLEDVWNLLDDLDKVTGGGAEAFWLRANAGLHLDVDKAMGLPGPSGKATPGLSPDERKALAEKAEDLQHQIQRVMVTRGVTATQLSSATANFKDPADAIVTQIAGTKGIPKRILVGSEMGQLASGQDRQNWNTQIQDRRTSYAGPCIVRPLVDRLVQYGYLPTPKEYIVVWPVMEDLTEDEKAELAGKLAMVSKNFGSTVFTEAEIRQICYRMKPAEDTVTDQFRAELAIKLTMANKQMGVTVFTDDEIRKTCYGWDPLTEDQKVPIGAPERITVKEPPPEGGEGDVPAPGTTVDLAHPTKAPKGLEGYEDELRALEEAIEDGNISAIDEILGVTQ